MRLKEYEGKALFRAYKIPTPLGEVVTAVPSKRPKQKVVVKSQIVIGKRGKGGGIIITEPSGVKKAVRSLLGHKINGFVVKELLIEEFLAIEQEIYVGLIIDGFSRCVQCILSAEGGMDIEELSRTHPEKIQSFALVNPTVSEIEKNIKGIDKKKELAAIVLKLYHLMKDYDADLVEINPLVLSKGKLIAADSKITIDDNGLYRQTQFKEEKKEELTRVEKKAYEYGLQYVDLDGNISVIGDGAGLVMATLDILQHYGGAAADFLDVGGGASIKKMEQAMEILRMRRTKGIFINIFGGITRCDEIAQGIIDYVKKHRVLIPMVVRMTGTNEQEAKVLLNNCGIHTYDSMEACAKKIVDMVK